MTNTQTPTEATDTREAQQLVEVEVGYLTPDRATIYKIAQRGEATDCPALVIVPKLGLDGRLASGFALVHTTTGRHVTAHYDPAALRAIAHDVAELDWSDTTSVALLKRVAEVLREHRFTSPSSEELPAHDAWGEDGKGKGLKRAAVPLAASMAQDYQLTHDKLWGDNPVPFEVDDPGSKRGKKMNTDHLMWVMRGVQDFAITYLLLALHQLDPKAADSAAAFLADQWDGGETIGEWMWEWNQALQSGRYVHVPGPPLVGDLFHPRVEVVVLRDPDDGTEVAAFANGERTEAEVTVVDPGRGYCRDDWDEQAQWSAGQASAAAGRTITAWYAQTADSKYII